MQQNYEAEELEDISGYYGGGSLLWNINNITSLKISTERTILETTVSDASSYISDEYYANLQHELTRDFLLSLNCSLKKNDYQFKNNSGYRQDNITKFGGEMRYYLGKYMYANTDYSHRERNSSDNSNDYVENIFSLSLNYKI